MGLTDKPREPTAGFAPPMGHAQPVELNAIHDAAERRGAEAQEFSRQEIARRLRLRCMELALESQRQNIDEVLDTEGLMKRAEAIHAFVTAAR